MIDNNLFNPFMSHNQLFVSIRHTRMQRVSIVIGDWKHST